MGQNSQEPVTHQDLEGLQNEVSEMKGVLSKVVEALNQLALLNERQQQMQTTTDKILSRIERIENRQHKSDVENAGNTKASQRLQELEKAVLEMHIEGERHKAQVKTAMWMVRSAWAVLAGGGATWLVTFLQHAPAR